MTSGSRRDRVERARARPTRSRSSTPGLTFTTAAPSGTQPGDRRRRRARRCGSRRARVRRGSRTRLPGPDAGRLSAAACARGDANRLPCRRARVSRGDSFPARRTAVDAGRAAAAEPAPAGASGGRPRDRASDAIAATTRRAIARSSHFGSRPDVAIDHCNLARTRLESHRRGLVRTWTAALGGVRGLAAHPPLR